MPCCLGSDEGSGRIVHWPAAQGGEKVLQLHPSSGSSILRDADSILSRWLMFEQKSHVRLSCL